MKRERWRLLLWWVSVAIWVAVGFAMGRAYEAQRIQQLIDDLFPPVVETPAPPVRL